MDIKLKFFYLLIFLGIVGQSQVANDLQSQRNRFSIPFTLVNNLIIINVELNHNTQMNMVLDSGSPYTLIVDDLGIEEFIVNEGRQVHIGGLGHGYNLIAYDSRGNHLKVGQSTKENTHLIIILNSPLHLSQYLGLPVHGITGYDIFKDFVVEINYITEKIIFYKHDYFYNKRSRRIRNHHVFPLIFHERKPYVHASVGSENQKADSAKLLVDTGGWDAVWWFEKSNPKISIPEKHYSDTLGFGMNGAVVGTRSKFDFIQLGDFKFNRPTTSFPDSLSLLHTISHVNRNGSLGGEILRRFNVIFDYKNQQMYLKPNRNYKDEFHYNMSGLKLEKTFEMLPFLEVKSVRYNSPAHLSGIKVGDLLTTINGKDILDGELGKINNLFKSNPGKKITVSLLRDGRKMTKSFYLTDPFE